MITLVCTKCSTTLNVDDGFAGGVCRCSNCGTIQTVPARGQRATGGEAIFERPTRGASKRDLEALGDIVTSSGLAGSGILRHARKPTAPPQEISRRHTLLASLLGAVVAMLVVVGLWLFLRMGGSDTVTDRAAVSSPGQVTNLPPAARTGPRFGPIALKDNGPVVYLIDRGDATRAYTASLQRAVIRSVTSLGTSRKFQVRYWTAEGESPALPPAPAEANAANIARLTLWMGDVAGGRATDASQSLDAALSVNPAEIVLVTGKAWQLDESFANEATVKLASSKTRVHAVALGGSSGNDALARFAAKSGGTFVDMDETTLSEIGK